MNGPPDAAAARLEGVSLKYGRIAALSDISLDIPAACVVGLIGPDGVGKSSLLALLAGVRSLQAGTLTVLGHDFRQRRAREQACPRIAYMPQGLGRNLYPTLSVQENLDFFGRLFGHDAQERRRRIDNLTASTGLAPFLARPAAKLSGGMKQKLGLCCALIHDPDLLVLDEPTTGVDPLSRKQFWDLIAAIRAQRPSMSVIVATAYMDEARRFDWLVAMDGGAVLATGTPLQLLRQTGVGTLEQAFLALLPEARRRDHKDVVIAPMSGHDGEVAIEARGLSKRFGDFMAVDHVDLRVYRGEIFGFIGSNGCGKSTTMKMMTGLVPASEGSASLLGRAVDARDLDLRRRIGYMSQSFSLYGELSIRQNLTLHARLFGIAENLVAQRVSSMARRFGLEQALDSLAADLPLGIRQRLALAVAMVHEPDLLILDEPTSGVDPIARDMFWQLMIDLARQDQVTIFVSTHFMNEAERCDRVSLMHAGKVMITGSPAELVRQRASENLEEAFISILEEAEATAAPYGGPGASRELPPVRQERPAAGGLAASIRRSLSYSKRETLELRHDPVRAALAFLGTAILMFIIGYGINLDVEKLSFAVLDRDQSVASRDYVLNLAGSRYFVEKQVLRSYADLDQRMRSGEVSLAIEIPEGFGRDMQRGRPTQIGAWIDGAMPTRAETVRGYVLAMHQMWQAEQARQGRNGNTAVASRVETRYRYNPDVRSLPAMVPAIVPLLLMMIPAMLTALSVVREKELGSILNLYATPVTRAEFMIGKQLPYLAIGMFNFFLMVVLAVTVFEVPVKGSLAALTLAAMVFVVCSTGLGLLASTFTRTQIAALFVTMIGTIIPCVQFSGLLNPVSSLEGPGALIGAIYPAAHFLTISRGVFSKALGVSELAGSFWPLMIAAPVIVCLAIFLLRKQEA